MKLERIAIAVLLVVCAGQAITGCLDRRRDRERTLAAANALADATAQGEWLKGQWRVTFRYLNQAKVELDETQRERDQQAILAATFRLEAKQLRGQVSAAPMLVVDTAQLETEFGDLDSAGFHVASIAQIWPVRPIGELHGQAVYRVELAPVPLQVGFACVGANGRFYVTAPRNRPLVLEKGVVDPDVCNPPPPPWNPLSLKAPSLPWAALLFGGGILIGGAIAH